MTMVKKCCDGFCYVTLKYEGQGDLKKFISLYPNHQFHTYLFSCLSCEFECMKVFLSPSIVL